MLTINIKMCKKGAKIKVVDDCTLQKKTKINDLPFSILSLVAKEKTKKK